MKKGLLNLILLVLVITNVALTAILVFAVVPAMNATSALVSKVAEAIDLEKELKDQASDTISIEDTDLFNFSEKMVITLAPSDNGKLNHVQLNVTLRLNKEDESYSKYKDELSKNEQLMRTEISRILATYTAETFAANTGQVELDIRDALRKLFNETEFIYSVGISDWVIP